MATLSIPYQNITAQVPDDGEVFRDANNPSNVYVRSGNIIYTVNLDTLGSGNRSAGTSSFTQQTGIDINAIPTRNYDIPTFARIMGTMFNNSSPVHSTTDLALFKSQPNPQTQGEVITQQLSAANANAPVVTSDKRGVILDPLGAGAKVGGTLNDIYSTIAPSSSNSPQTGGAASTTNSDIQSLLANPSLATSGNYARAGNGSIIDVRTGQVVQTGGPTTQQTGGQQGGSQPTNANANADAAFEQLLSNANLPADQQAMIRAIYGAASANDKALYDRLTGGIQAATKFSDPFFKAQTRLVLDALDRSFKDEDGDLAYNENRYRTALEDLRKDLTASKDYLSFQENQELKGLERRYTQDLEATQNDMAARGFTTSSIRSKAEGLVNDSYGDLRESTRRSFRDQQMNAQNKLDRGVRDTATEIARLQEIARGNKLSAFRQTEEKVGSTNLPSYSGFNPLGGVGGTIPRQQATDSLSFASNFVF